ncbi:hypothetical protein SH661x_000476 [Planctomicrobium sp. SH661]|uniref:hypothetical protein n=1 Tax=Planctomicrobium sp. SH661 TaxID=3448124 RepID=UPI003F5C19A6
MTTTPPAPSSLSSWFFSILFWVCLGLCTLIFTALVLAPRWWEAERLHARFTKNALVIRDLEQGNQHLMRVAQALENDPDYRNRVASSELGTVTPGETRIPLDTSLAYDPRVLAGSPPTAAASQQASWYLPFLEVTATSSNVRIRLGLLALVLVFLSFACMNDRFLTDGRQNLVRFISRCAGVRYTTPGSITNPNSPPASSTGAVAGSTRPLKGS